MVPRQPLPWLYPVWACLFVACQSPTASDDEVAWRPQPPREPLVLADERATPNVLSPLPAGTRIALPQPPRARLGIPLPDGGCLPGLNGVRRSGPLDRPAEHGAVPRVVGIAVDETGIEWYEHADGSMTTCRYVWNKKFARWEPMTFHAVAAR